MMSTLDSKKICFPGKPGVFRNIAQAKRVFGVESPKTFPLTPPRQDSLAPSVGSVEGMEALEEWFGEDEWVPHGFNPL